MTSSFYTVLNQRTGLTIAEKTLDARSLVDRTIGLIGKRTLEDGHGLIIRKCNMVHMFFMLFPIDVVFCTADDTVNGLQTNLKPWRVSKLYRKATHAIELPAGSICKNNIQLGDKLLITKSKTV